MTQGVLRLTAILLVIAVTLSAVAGCRIDSNDSTDLNDRIVLDWQDYAYTVQTIQLPDDMGDVLRAIYHNGMVFFDCYNTENNSFSIYSINLDGKDITQLKDYVPPAAVPDDAIGTVNINAMFIDDEDSLWVFEQWYFYKPDFPEHLDTTNMEDDELWEYYSITDFGSCLRKLDESGAQVDYINIGSLALSDNYLHVSDFAVDDSGNIYLAIRYGDGLVDIYVLDSSGDTRFTLNYEDNFGSFVRLPDSKIAISPAPYHLFNNPVHELQVIDIETKSLNETVEIPIIFAKVYNGGSVFDFLVDDGISLYGYNQGEESFKILTWVEYDVDSNNIVQVEMLDNGDIICVATGWDSIKQGFNTQVLVFEKVPQRAERIEIELATYGYTGEYDEAVAEFNRASASHRVVVVDYSVYDMVDNSNAGIAYLTTQISAGNTPDILDISALPSSVTMQYAEKGVFADIYKFIDEDTGFSRSDFLEPVFQAAEIDGKLYTALHTFSTLALAGHPSVVGTDTGWALEDLLSIIELHPEASSPVGHWLTKDILLQRILMPDIDKYIDWTKGETYFDTPEFTRTLELVNTLPVMADSTDYNPERLTHDPFLDIAEGRQIIMPVEITGFPGLWLTKMWFDGEAMLKTYPSTSGTGSILSIPSGFAIFENSPNKDVAWAFVSTFLSEEWQRRNIHNGFPTNKFVFNLRVSEALETDYSNELVFYTEDGIPLGNPDIEPLSQRDVDILEALIDFAAVIDVWGYDNTVWTIISEEASDYFKGMRNAEDTAKIIQNRVSILVSERS